MSSFLVANVLLGVLMQQGGATQSTTSTDSDPRAVHLLREAERRLYSPLDQGLRSLSFELPWTSSLGNVGFLSVAWTATGAATASFEVDDTTLAKALAGTAKAQRARSEAGLRQMYAESMRDLGVQLAGVQTGRMLSDLLRCYTVAHAGTEEGLVKLVATLRPGAESLSREQVLLLDRSGLPRRVRQKVQTPFGVTQNEQLFEWESIAGTDRFVLNSIATRQEGSEVTLRFERAKFGEYLLVDQVLVTAKAEKQVIDVRNFVIDGSPATATVPPSRAPDLVQELLAAATAAEQAGRFQQALAEIERASEIALGQSDARLLARCMEATAQLLMTEGRYGPTAAAFAAEAWTEAATAWEKSGEQDRAARARLEGAVALTQTDPARRAEARHLVGTRVGDRPIAAPGETGAVLAALAAWGMVDPAEATPREKLALLEQAVTLARSSRDQWLIGRTQLLLGCAQLESGAEVEVARARATLSAAAAAFAAGGHLAARASTLIRIAETVDPTIDPGATWTQAFQAHAAAADASRACNRHGRAARLAVTGLWYKSGGNWLALDFADATLLQKFARFAEQGGDPEFAQACRTLYIDLMRHSLPKSWTATRPGPAGSAGGGACNNCGGVGHFPPGVFGRQPTPCLNCNMTGRR